MADWTGSALASCQDRGDAGWTDDELVSCADRPASVALLFEPRDTSIDDDYEASLSNWTLMQMESVCDG